jgi:hypothetical protein
MMGNWLYDTPRNFFSKECRFKECHNKENFFQGTPQQGMPLQGKIFPRNAVSKEFLL